MERVHKAFDHYLPLEILEARANQYLNFYQENISVRKYSLKFNSLSRYAPSTEDRVHLFVDRLDSCLVRECTIALFDKDMDIATM